MTFRDVGLFSLKKYFMIIFFIFRKEELMAAPSIIAVHNGCFRECSCYSVCGEGNSQILKILIYD